MDKITDQDIREIQIKVKDIVEDDTKGIDQSLDIGPKGSRKQYEIVHKIDGTTQALALAPIVNGQADYNQTTIVVAGTQPGLNESTGNAVVASGFGGLVKGQLTPQYTDIDRFYHETAAKLSENGGGQIYAMSGFSQSGPPVAKVAAEQGVKKVTNFTDWGAKQAVEAGYFSPKELHHLNRYATIYSDMGKELTSLDGGGGEIPYGKKIYVEATPGLNNPIGDHSPSFFKLKGNGLNMDYYIKNGLFVSGMTEDQVIEAAKIKANRAKGFKLFELETWNDSTNYKDYVKEYKKTYGGFARSNLKPRNFSKPVSSPSMGPYRAQLLSQTKRASGHLRAFGHYLSSRGYSGSAMIFIDDAQMALLANHMKTIAEDSHDQLERLADRTIEHARQLWDLVDLWSYRDLQEWEVLAIFEEAGVGPEMIEDIQQFCLEILDGSKAIKEKLDHLAIETTTAVQKSLENDDALAGEFNQWQHQI